MTARTSRQPVLVLLVEDSPGDAELMTEALEAGDLPVCVTHIDNGEEAVQYLRREGEHRDAPRPDLVLLDLHLPRMNGHEVLTAIKQDEGLRLVPVVLLTGSDTEEAFQEAYDRHVNCCVAKPSDLGQFAEVVRKIETFWLQLASRHRPACTHPTPPLPVAEA
jgi:chemotaxis family two-component system response regulator Rcp1